MNRNGSQHPARANGSFPRLWPRTPPFGFRPDPYGAAPTVSSFPGRFGRRGDRLWDVQNTILFRDRKPWNAGRKLGAKRALNPQQVWAVRFWLDQGRCVRDRAMFDLAIDSKLRACVSVKVRVGDLVSGGRVRSRAIVFQQRQADPFSLSFLNLPARASLPGLSAGAAQVMISPSRAGSTTPRT